MKVAAAKPRTLRSIPGCLAAAVMFAVACSSVGTSDPAAPSGLDAGAGASPSAAAPSANDGAASDGREPALDGSARAPDVDGGAIGDAAPAPSPDAGTHDARAADAAPADTSIFPRKVGYSWTYLTTGTAAACPAGTHVSEVRAHADACGIPVVEVTTFCSSAALWSSGGGDDAQVCWSGSLQHSFGLPIAEGTTFTYFGGSYTWHAAGTVAVTAGTFSDCWTMKENSSAVVYEATYCRGVGLVKMVQQQVQVNLHVELVSKNF